MFSFLFSLSLISWIKHVVYGLGIGIIMALTGAGGGILSIPVLMMALDMDMQGAKPVSLLAVGLGAAFGAIHGLRNKLLDIRTVLYMSLLGAVLSPFGIWLSQQIGQRPLTVIFSGVLLLAGWRSLRPLWTKPSAETEAQAAKPCMIDPHSGHIVWTPTSFVTLGLIGSITGLLSGMLGVGGGFFMVPMLRRLTNLRYQNILVASLGVIALVSGYSALEIMGQSAAISAGAIWFILAVLIGMLVGRILAPRVPSHWLHASFGIAVLLAAAMLLIRTFAPQWLHS